MMTPSPPMKQASLDLSARRISRPEILIYMERVGPWTALVELIGLYCLEGKNGRLPFALEAMLRLHFLQQWFRLSNLSIEESFFDTSIYRAFVQIDAHSRRPDDSIIRPPLEQTQARIDHRQRPSYGSRLAAQGRHRSGYDPRLLPQFYQEQRQGTRPRDGFEPERQSVALRHGGSHWSGCQRRGEVTCDHEPWQTQRARQEQVCRRAH